MTARNHHYLSQCYLKGFTKGGAKKSKITVIDLIRKKSFETIPKKVGGIRDFNRIDIEGVEPDAIEYSLSEFESQAATALRKIEKTLIFDGENKTLILNLLALLAIRSPEMRENWRKTQAGLSERIMEMSLASKEIWESQMNQMRESGVKTNDDISYEEMKRFFDSKAYSIKLSTEHHIGMEMVGINAIFPHLLGRKWILVKSTDETGPVVTTDNPVILTWKEPDKIPPFYRNSPGYGMSGTQVYFPISRNLALIGEFDGREGVVEGNKQLVANLNTVMIGFTYKQIYTPKIGFYFMGKDGDILDGRHILSYIGV